jgi:Protein of unknown function (DUF1592)/Protein of unknown function (DUF1588)/Protein of unknown function (DUF1587)/Protein of unknown function (DUF1585)/Protein of unknown function (DUF1595)/Planctomycete cytochrome C
MIFALSLIITSISMAEDSFQEKVARFLDSHCIKCHSEGNDEAGINFEAFSNHQQALQAGKLWLRVRDVIEGGTMPPATEARPAQDHLTSVVDWIESDFLGSMCGAEQATHAPMARRLNRREYNNTVRDLLYIEIDLAKDFPADEISFGFDNVATALSISPIHVEHYLAAAERAVEMAIQLPDATNYPPIELIGLTTYPLAKDGPATFEHHLRPGRYLADFSLVRVGVSELVPPPTLQIGFGTDVRRLDAVRIQDETIVYRFWMEVCQDDHTVSVRLSDHQTHQSPANPNQDATANVSGDQRYGGNRGMHVDSMVVRGPIKMPDELPDSHRQLIDCRPEPSDASRLKCGTEILERLTRRAFRRPIHPSELLPSIQLFETALLRGESFERSIQIAIMQVLLAPDFLHHLESGSLADEDSLDAKESTALSDYRLANRLSYFLWNSMPDDELIQAAADGSLRSSINDQVDRMLQDSKSQSFIESFAGQWLQLRKLVDIQPDRQRFESFSDTLRDDMRHETEMFVANIFRNKRSVLEMLDADYSFINARLANHYGLKVGPQLTDEQFEFVQLDPVQRGGLLTQASILTLTSNPNRTSPVKRGQWILQQILGTPPPPPPATVEKLDESPQSEQSGSLRERFERHRSQSECAACHNQMDPLGFALENFDAIGRWRSTDGGFPIEAGGQLSGERHFKDAREFRLLLINSEAKRFSRCLIENMLVYGLGRGLEPADYCTVESIRKRLVTHHYLADQLIKGIVNSPQFLAK